MRHYFLYLTIPILFIFTSPAYAYLDPGTGSMILQSLIGALVGVGIVLKVYWTKIKFAILDRKSKKD